MAFQVITTDYQTHQHDIQFVRQQVFIIEQHIDPTLEWDADDHSALFALAQDQHKKPIGTARLLASGKIGRMAVLAAWRHQGVGSAMLNILIDEAKQRAWPQIQLSAQVAAIGFYQRHQFRVQGDIYLEADIPHQRMLRQL